MLQILNTRGVVAVVGRTRRARLWDLAERWYPRWRRSRCATAERAFAAKRFRALGVRLTREGWEAHPEVSDDPIPDRVTFLSPFDRLIHDRDRAEALFDFHYRLEMYVPKAKREYGYYVLPVLVGDRIVGRIEPRFDRKTGTLDVLGAWGDTSRSDEGLASLRAWLVANAASVASGRALRDARDPRGTGAGQRDRRDHDADLPDLHVRPGRRRRPQGLRLRPGRQPDADGAAGVHRIARGRSARPRVLVGARRGHDAHAPALAGRPRRRRNDVYGGIYRMFTKVYEPKGYRFTFLTPEEISTGLAEHLDERTRLVWLETPTNPALNIVDIAAASEAAHAVGATVVVDNTFATPYLQQPLALGADVALHSTTKYLGGHSDVVGGFVATNDDADRRGARVPAEVARSGARAVRRLARAPRGEDARREDGPPLRERRRGRFVPRTAPARGARPLPRSALASRARDRRAPDAELRRHGLVPPRATSRRPSTSSRARGSGSSPRASEASRASSSTRPA